MKMLMGAAVAMGLLSGLAQAETLFKIVTVKDDITVGLNDAELKEHGGDAGGIAKAIAAKGSLTLWQYAVTKQGSESVVAPRAKVGILAAQSLRVEPYKQPFKVLPHEGGAQYEPGPEACRDRGDADRVRGRSHYRARPARGGALAVAVMASVRS
jgi:hypothetical protein